MRNQKKRKGFSSRKEDWQKKLRILALPLIVIILILVIVLADRIPGNQEVSSDSLEVSGETSVDDPSGTEEGGDTEETESAAEGESGSDETAENGENELKPNDIPEITELMEEYCRAKTECDAETMYRLYGKTDMTGVEELCQRMQWRAKYVESMENVQCYTLPGMNENDYVVYVTADIKFRVTDVMAPTIMWCYVRREADGTYHIVEDVTAEEAEYVAKAEKTEGVRELAAQVNEQLEEAVASDTRLASAYGMLKNGTTVLAESSAVAVTEPAETESTAASQEAETAAP